MILKNVATEEKSHGLKERKIVSAYLKVGGEGVGQFLKGEWDTEPCSISDSELCDEAIESYNDWLADLEDSADHVQSQAPDELI